MKTLLVMGLLSLTTQAYSAVVKSYNAEEGCTLYRVTSEEAGAKVKVFANETIVYPKAVYGLTFEDLEINFDNREAKVQVSINIVMGLNRPLTASKPTISPENPKFTTLVNHLNRKLNSLEKVCISSDNKIVYASQFESNK